MNKKELHKIAPKLSEISLHKTGFEIPENYFDSLEDIVIAKLKAEALQNNVENAAEITDNYFSSVEDTISAKIKSNSKVISLKNKFTRIAAPLAIAASLLLIFMLNNNSQNITFDSLASSDIENWIDNGGIDIDAYSIASIYPEIELTNDMYSDTLSDDEVLDYLYEEDLEDIIYEN